MWLRLDMLDDATLEAATSRGLLRRAQRDLATRTARITQHDERQAVIELHDATVTLGAGALREARCTCSSREVCRHIIGAILLLRESEDRIPTGTDEGGTDVPPSTSDPLAEILALSEKDLARAYGRARLSRVREAAAALGAPAVTVSGSSCVIKFEEHPEVRYVAGLGIDGMVCKASASDAKYPCAQALVAIRRLHGIEQPPDEPSPPRVEPDDAGATETTCGIAHDLLVEWARSGLAAAPETLEDRLFDAAIGARAAGLFRLGAELRRLSEDVRRRRERDSEFDPSETLRAASRCFALIEALRQSPADGTLRGRPRESFDPIGDLRLIGCGIEIWQTPSGARGATAYFYAHSQRRWFTASLARASGQDPGFVPEHAIEHEMVWGRSLAELAHSYCHLQNAAASPSGRLSLSRETQAHLIQGRPQREAITLWENGFSDWSKLDAFTGHIFSPALRRPRQHAEIVALMPARIGHASFDEIRQELSIPAFDHLGKRIDLVVENVAHRRRRMQAVEELLQGKPPEVIFATLAGRDGAIALFPYALIGPTETSVLSLDRCGRTRTGRLAAGEQRSVRANGLGDRIADRLAARQSPRPALPSATSHLLAVTLDHLLGLCELGGQMRDPGCTAHMAALGDRMEGIGLHPFASLLSAVATAEGRKRAEAILIATHALDTLRQLSRRPVS